MPRPPLIFLSVPGLRGADLSSMPSLRAMTNGYDQCSLQPSFPAVTWPVQANILTGCLAYRHGVVANGWYDRQTGRVEMWTMKNAHVQATPIWETLGEREPGRTAAVWFPMLAKECSADYACMPAPVHKPDGSEDLWCYSKPQSLYGELLDALGHFPLQHFWGPLANIESTLWIVRSSVMAAERFRPGFWYIYLPHLDYAAQRSGPDSPAAQQALTELDGALRSLREGMENAYAGGPCHWLIASEYVINDVNHVSYPNRVLREEGLLRVREVAGMEELDFLESEAWCLVDHQCGHVFVRNRDPEVAQRIQSIFSRMAGFSEVLRGTERSKYGLDHERSGDVILISEPRSWQAYYWWHDDGMAPEYARRVDIHRKPGYDPVELFWDRAANGVPMDATLVRGSHGAPTVEESQQGIFLCPPGGLSGRELIRDIDVKSIVVEMAARGAF